MVKKYIVPLCFIALFVSLIFNSIQYKDIRAYEQKQDQIDNEVKASINQLIHVIDSTDFSKFGSERIDLISSGAERTFTLVRFSTFRDDENIYNCFEDLFNFFSKRDIDEIRKNGEQIKNLMDKIFDKKKSNVFAEWEINSNNCKALAEFFQQIAKTS